MEVSNSTLVVSAALKAEVEALAAQEHRSIKDVLQDAVSRYAEVQREQRTQGNRKVFRTTELDDAQVTAIITGRMDPRHDYLNEELE